MRRRAIIALVTGGLAWAWWRPFRVVVEGDSMEPTLSPGDQLVAVRPRRLRRGDVVVVRPAERGFEMVKRLAGLPGDRLAGRTLGAGEHWVVGDRPGRSTDSRSFGPVRSSEVTGVVRFRYLPRPGRVR